MISLTHSGTEPIGAKRARFGHDNSTDMAGLAPARAPLGQPWRPDSGTAPLLSAKERMRQLGEGTVVFLHAAVTNAVAVRSIWLTAVGPSFGHSGWLLAPGASEATVIVLDVETKEGCLIAASGAQLASEASSEGLTVSEGPPQRICELLMSLCCSAAGEHFEDGIESRFSQELVWMIAQQGGIVADVLSGLISLDRIDEEVASEGLRWVGLMEHPGSHFSRRRLLEKCLFAASPKVRDGAALGLAFLNDPHGIPYLRQAMNREEREWLRKRVRQVIDQLEKRERCR